MTLGPLGNTAGLSGAQNDVAGQVRRARADGQAERAEGLGATDADQETSDRDADGRRIWEIGSDKEDDASPPDDQDQPSEPAEPKAKDPTGNSGGLLDLTG